jgi:biuret amidohydrolase
VFLSGRDLKCKAVKVSQDERDEAVTAGEPGPPGRARALDDWVLPWPRVKANWDRAALLVIDVQNYSCNPLTGVAELLLTEGSPFAAYYIGRVTTVMVPNIRRLLLAFRRDGREVIYTRHGPFLPNGRDLVQWRQMRNADAVSVTGRPTLWPSGSYEHQIVNDLEPVAGELVIDKNSSSPFNSTGIDQVLRNLGVETLVLTGTATDMCVETTGRDAADRGYGVIVVEDATATYHEEHHRASLAALARVYGQVWTTSRVITSLGEAARQRAAGERDGSSAMSKADKEWQ